jgi:plastocyanin domain-containing protein
LIKGEKMEMKKLILILAAIIIGTIVLVSARNIAQGGVNTLNTANQNTGLQNTGSQSTGNVATVTNGVQNVRLSLDNNGDYLLQPSVLKKGVPVKMEVDLSSVTGCARSIVIPSFNVRKGVSTGNNIIEFTPDKTGEFTIHCSMNMYRGTFTVVDENGQKSDFVETQASPSAAGSGGTCGISAGGGCGCGAGNI